MLILLMGLVKASHYVRTKIVDSWDRKRILHHRNSSVSGSLALSFGVALVVIFLSILLASTGKRVPPNEARGVLTCDYAPFENALYISSPNGSGGRGKRQGFTGTDHGVLALPHAGSVNFTVSHNIATFAGTLIHTIADAVLDTVDGAAVDGGAVLLTKLVAAFLETISITVAPAVAEAHRASFCGAVARAVPRTDLGAYVHPGAGADAASLVFRPSAVPSSRPTPLPTPATAAPSYAPKPLPTSRPTTGAPSYAPSPVPTSVPTPVPAPRPTVNNVMTDGNIRTAVAAWLADATAAEALYGHISRG